MIAGVMIAFAIVVNIVLGHDRDVAPQAVAPEADYMGQDGNEDYHLMWDIEDAAYTMEALALALNIEPYSTDFADPKRPRFRAEDSRPIVGGHYVFGAVIVEPNELVDSTEVLTFHDGFKTDNVVRGILITNGFFSEEAVYQAEDRPIVLLNAVKLTQQFKELQLPLRTGQDNNPSPS